MREAFADKYGLAPTPANVYGVLSLIVWALILVVSVKYVSFILRADNRGEGGVLALLALILQRNRREGDKARRQTLIVLGLFGSALLYGDGVITPAISVLSAVEGLEVITPALDVVVIPLTLVILITLFLAQKKGTTKVGRVYGPVMALWFVSIAILGIVEIAHAPKILIAVNPWYAVQFFVNHGLAGMAILGAIILVVTGGEALYADMGHFGARPIRLAWFYLVLPALLLNYFGQGALILTDPAGAENPFYMLAPRILLYPLVILATLAAITASQALISGAFSLTQQAVQLGYWPRVNIVHTSKTETGQIYIPEVNRALMIMCVLVVLGFGSVDALGAAYGIALAITMTITTILFYELARSQWNWSLRKAGAFAAFFLLIDLSFVGSNFLKLVKGGWVPILIALAVFALMTTWYRGRKHVQKMLKRASLPIDLFLDSVAENKPVRVKGTAIFMTSDAEGAPLVLLHHLKHNKMLHEQVVLLSVLPTTVPEILDSERVQVTRMREGFWRVKARYGFMETPNVPDVLAKCVDEGLVAKPLETTYYLGRERLIPLPTNESKVRMARWRKKFFVFMSANSRTATEFFQIPPNRVVELGAQLEF
jgi:KUP system potassium uptake protein